MRVLVVGANGKTGRRVVERLRGTSHEPVAMVREEEHEPRSLGRYGSIPRDDVAEVLVACLEVPATEGETVEILGDGTPIRAALERL